jgi:hypothetical protein
MPDKYSNAPGAPIAFNARYIGEFAAEVSRYSVNGCFTMETNGPATPLMFTAKADIIGTETVTLQYLLMPVRIRP